MEDFELVAGEVSLDEARQADFNGWGDWVLDHMQERVSDDSGRLEALHQVRVHTQIGDTALKAS